MMIDRTQSRDWQLDITWSPRSSAFVYRVIASLFTNKRCANGCKQKSQNLVIRKAVTHQLASFLPRIYWHRVQIISVFSCHTCAKNTNKGGRLTTHASEAKGFECLFVLPFADAAHAHPINSMLTSCMGANTIASWPRHVECTCWIILFKIENF